MVATGAPRTIRSMWVGRTEESDEHLVVNEIGHVVRVRTFHDAWKTKTVVPTLSSLLQLLRISSLRVTTWMQGV